MRGSLVLVLMWVAGCGSQPVPVTGAHGVVPAPVRPPAAPEPKQPAAALFGQVIEGAYKRQSRFELSEDTIYGWRIKLPCTGPTVYRETLQLPDVGDWSFDPAATKQTRVSADRKRAVTEDYSGCYDGWIQHAWTIAPNDPPGEYVLTVEVDGYQPQTFRGRFLKPEDFESAPARRRRE
ncbi:MAG TPA: hypothetical protein VN253_01255 [Kofleriaceae bacterium]|nr:hypothetical protein [Kofleriaceae bacterium]